MKPRSTSPRGAAAHCVIPSLALQMTQLVLQSQKQAIVIGTAVFHIFYTPAESHKDRVGTPPACAGMANIHTLQPQGDTRF